MIGKRFNLTLNQVFLLSVLSLVVLLGILFYVLLDGSRQSILQSSNQIRVEVGSRIADHVGQYRDQAEEAVSDIERQIRTGLVQLDRPETVEAALYAEVLDHPQAAEVTFTHAEGRGFDEQGNLHPATNGKWQISVFRASAADHQLAIFARRVNWVSNAFYADVTPIHDAGDLVAQSLPATQPVPDPTVNGTFIGSVTQGDAGRPIWSDLQNSELDPDHRVEVTVQQSLFDAGGNLWGVVRVGLMVDELNKIVKQGAPPEHQCFLCDPQGQLVTALNPSDHLETTGAGDDADLRISPSRLAPEIAEALRLPALGEATLDHPAWDAIRQDGRNYLVTFVSLPRTQQWILGIVVPEDYYIADLRRMQRNLLLATLAVIVAILAGGVLTLRAVQRGLSRVMGITAKMRHFDFAPSNASAPFRDVQDVIDSIEQSKTAMRAMGKYVPVDLVRDLYEMNREPMLGGQMMDVSLMFTDIKGFTSKTEMLPGDRLAEALGRYLEVMAGAIQAHSGTIDKYIGDSVMVLWNAPRAVPNDAAKACAAALDCTRAAQALFASASWQGLSPWITRYGIHRDQVMVGHFGAPNRMSYTALGDGVNLASRLEGLNKLYGTTIIVSQSIRDAAGNTFAFRQLDLVAVSGKTQAVKIHELLGEGETVRTRAIVDYEAGLQAYWGRDFQIALKLFEAHPDDPPSKVLAERCRHFLVEPPSENWQGVFISMSK